MPTKKDGTPPAQPPTDTKTRTGGGGGDDDSSSALEEGSVIQPGGDEDEPLLKHRKDLVTAGDATESRGLGEFSFNPNSLVGSWFHRLENDRMIWQGVVVGQPASTTYLVQVDKLDVGAEQVQRLVPLEQMVNDDDGYDWRFYDSEDECKSAYARWIATERERETA